MVGYKTILDEEVRPNRSALPSRASHLTELQLNPIHAEQAKGALNEASKASSAEKIHKRRTFVKYGERT